MKSNYIALAFVALALASCADKPNGWSVTGEVNGEGEYTLSLEGFNNNGLWYVIDSLHTKDGEFKYASPEPAAYPEIMRLGLEGQYIYFPIDSIDHISIFAEADDFAIDYRLDGTMQARTIKSLDSLINVSVADRGVAVTSADRTLKQDLFVRAFEDPSVMPLYYLVNKSIGDVALFDAADPADIRFFGAVAQRFYTESPDDPRGQFVLSTYKKLRASQKNEVLEIEVPETSIIDIVRADSRGKSHSLAEMASKGDVVLLNFTAYALEASPAYNVLLNSLYDRFHSSGLQIYQIAFDGDESFWKETARNLPWTAVWNSTTDGDVVLASYNVGGLPTTFVIDRTGTIVARVEDPEQLEATVKSYM